MTDNTEAVEKLAEVIAGDRAVDHDTIFPSDRDLAQAVLAAIQADPLAYVKPKPLVWLPHSHVDYLYQADVANGFYEIKDTYTPNLFELSIGSDRKGVGTKWHSSHNTLEAAQAAAYDDLCNRVKELF